MLADVPMVFVLVGIAAYTVLSGADFGAGLWTLVPGGGQAGAAATRDHTRHAIGPVWEANHVWLIFVLTVAWTCYPGAFGSIVSTLAVPLLIAAIGIIFRGTAYALRSQFSRDQEHGVRLMEYLFALSSVLTPFALATVIGAIATGRVPVGNARGDLITSWLNPVSVLAGVLAVAFSGYLAAVYLAADARRLAERALVHDFRIRALASGVVAGALALAGLLVIRVSARPLWHGLTSGLGLAFVVVSALAGVVTMVLVFFGRFGSARMSAALAVAAVIAGWAAAQSPLVLPGLTVAEAAAGRSTLIATIVGVAVGAVVLVPSLAVLYSLVLRGRLDTAAVPDSVAADSGGAAGPGGAAGSGGVPRAAGAAGSGGGRPGAAGGRSPAGVRDRLAAGFAVVTMVAGAGLLVFADPAWAHALGAVALIACAVTVFTLASRPAAELREQQAGSREHAAGEAARLTGSRRRNYPQKLARECGTLHKRMCRVPHSCVSGSGRKGLDVETVLVVRMMRRRCSMAGLPRHPADVRNHGNVTSPWSGPLQSHIAVVVLGVRNGASVAGGVSRAEVRWRAKTGGAGSGAGGATARGENGVPGRVGRGHHRRMGGFVPGVRLAGGVLCGGCPAAACGGVPGAGVRGWLAWQLGFDPRGGVTVPDWLAAPWQRLAEVTGGAVFHDGTGGLTRARAALSWYPRDVWRYVLSCQWSRIAEEEAFGGRCAEAGDELGSVVVTARLARDLMRLWLLMQRRYPPYSKWLGSAFARAPGGAGLGRHLAAALAAAGWAARERELGLAYRMAAGAHNRLGLTEPLDPGTRPYFDRPYQVLGAGRFAAALSGAITDPLVRRLGPAGTADQVIDSTPALGDLRYARAVTSVSGI